MLIFCVADHVQAETLKVTGGATITENFLEPIRDAFAKSSGVTLEISNSTPAQGWQQLTAEQVDAAVYGLSFNEVVASVEKQGGSTANRAEMMPQVIGMMDAGTKIIANKDVGLASLSPSQLAGIFSGEITNWSAVGGPDKAIVVVLGTKYPAILEQFKKNLMKGKDYSGNAMQVETYADIKEKVASTPGAIGFSTAALLDDSIQPIRYSGGMRIVTLITKGPESPAAEKLIHFIQKEGKKYVKQ
ncbi:MAG: substrate-binding domain-containing protein [bacterium]|nr:substrate-binding domain-containing protein [bacterium]